MSRYTPVENCPECGSENIQVIDMLFNVEDQTFQSRMLCTDCFADFWEEEEEEKTATE